MRWGAHHWRAAIGMGLLAGLVALACAVRDRGAVALRWESGRDDAGCVECHEAEARDLQASRHHAGPRGGMGCLSCHTPHAAGEDGDLGPSLAAAECEDCHAEVVAQFRLPFRHPLGAMVGCTDCHPPHGLPRHELREVTRHVACVECHIDLRGPFTYPHEGSHRRGCMTCHEPHGSANRRLLTYASSRMLCLECHTVDDGLHAQNPGSIFRECLHCHTEVHGSNWDRVLLR